MEKIFPLKARICYCNVYYDQVCNNIENVIVFKIKSTVLCKSQESPRNCI